ncbi:MAG: cadherin domain-containing protein [Hyphomicrobiales bacterium]
MLKTSTIKNVVHSKDTNKQRVFIVGASVATLIASGETTIDNKLFSSGDVSSAATDSDDRITIGSKGGVIDLGDGADTITGGSAIDTILGGAGADQIFGGAGLDNFVVIGITINAGYTIEDLQDIAGTGVDLSALLDLATINNHSVSDLVTGEAIDGGADGAIVYIFGAADFTGITLANITKMYLDNEVVISNATLTASGITELFGTGSIKADSGLLDLDGITVPEVIDIKDADGNIILPTFSHGGGAVNVAENSSLVGTFIVTDASAVGEVTYALSGADADLFDIDRTTGAVSFKAAPDYESVTDEFDLTITATDEHQKSTSQDVTITVTNVEEAPTFVESAISVEAAENQTTVTTSVATDDEGADIAYSLGGDDATLFEIDQDSGAITFTDAPNYEVDPTVYNVVVTASDGGLSSTQNVQINVADVTEEIVQLSELNGSNGYRLVGNEANDFSGSSVSAAGDINGDGYDDFIIGAPLASNLDDEAGSSYVVFGKATNSTSSIDLASLNGTLGFRLDGAVEDGNSGASVSNAGDINGDGFDDIIVSSSFSSDTSVGVNHVVFGKAAGFDAVINLSSLDGSDGFKLNSVATAEFNGSSVSSAGDVNGDGFDDLIVGAYYATPNGTESGSSYVLYGKAETYDSTVELTNLTAADGYRIDGVTEDDKSGHSVSGAGDVNGDGFDDLIVSAIYTDHNGSNSGSSYVVYGKPTNANVSVDLGLLDGTNGYRLDGVLENERSGISVSAAGDVNGDGYDDLVIGSPYADDFDTSYVVFGKETDSTAVVDLGSLNGSTGFRIVGDTVFENAGLSVSSIGDFNGDGFDDIIIGAPNARSDENNTGASFVLFGSANGFDATASLANLDGTNGFRVDGVSGADYSGVSVSGAGDVNGDGYDDLIIGARHADPEEDVLTGAGYIVYGGGQYAANDEVATSGDDALIGTTGDDTIYGLAGNDVIRTGYGDDNLTGGEGADRLYGGGGADTFTFSAGDSVISIDATDVDNGKITGYDIIEDFKLGNVGVGDVYDITGGLHIADDFTGIGASTLKADNHVISGSVVNNGVIAFYNEGSLLQLSTQADIAAAVQFLQLHNIGNAGATVAFDVGSDMFLFTQGDDDGTNEQDILVRLEGVQSDYLGEILQSTPYFAANQLSVEVAEEETAVTTSIANDFAGDDLSYALSGDDAGLFKVSGEGVITFKSAPNYETPQDIGANNIYNIVLTATDESGLTAAQNVSITVADILDSYVNLAELNGTNGYRLDGEEENDRAGKGASNAGDVNGDGYDDFMISGNSGAPDYVVFGKATDNTEIIALGSLDGSNGFILDGVNLDTIGGAMSADDINGDGFADLILMGPLSSNGATKDAYVVYGKADYSSGSLDLTNFDGTNGVIINGALDGTTAGANLASLGDVNGDGFGDFMISMNSTSISYVIFGQSAFASNSFNVSSLDGTNGFKIDTSSGNNSGFFASAAGDVNGDGFDDIIIGATKAGPPFATLGDEDAYIIFGSATFSDTLTVSSLNGTNGPKLISTISYSSESNRDTKYPVSNIGDINGDGYDDIITGQSTQFIIYGTEDFASTAINLDNLNGTNGFKLTGASSEGLNYLSAAGDFNGDGIDDFIVGSSFSIFNGTGSGSSFVIFGTEAGFGASFDVSSVNGENGFRIDGVAPNDASGNGVSGVGDVNGDGYDDLLIGAQLAGNNGDFSGSSYIIYGGGQYAANDAVATSGDDVLIGTTSSDVKNSGAGDDVIRTGFGDDFLIGAEGADRLYGGGGSDVFIFTPGDSKIIIDGSGDNGTISGYDVIEDFKVGDGTHDSETIEITNGVGYVAPDFATGGTLGSLTIDGNVISEVIVNDGIAQFSSPPFGAPTISNQASLAAAIEALQVIDLGDVGATVAFDVGADTFIFSQGSDNGVDNDLDVVVRLEDVQVDSLVEIMGNGAFDLFLN